jgi:hypothetical protein
VETLAACVLLSIMAAACTSVLRSAFAALPASDADVSIDLLTLAADELIRNPFKYDIVAIADLHAALIHVDIDDETMLHVQVDRIETTSPETDGVWLAISATSDSNRVVFRWIPAPPDDEDAAP